MKIIPKLEWGSNRVTKKNEKPHKHSNGTSEEEFTN